MAVSERGKASNERAPDLPALVRSGARANTWHAPRGRGAGAAASCEYALNNPPGDPSYVEVKLDGMQINLNDPNGWQISPDRRLITLQGCACAAISGQLQHKLSVRVLCNRVVLQ